MNDEEINRAIAEHFGWRLIPCHDDGFEKATGERWLDPDGDIGLTPPDYSSDLNAMHEAEKALDVDIDSGDSPRYVYARNLYNIVESVCQPFRATARQRSEAFLRVVGKWRGEETNP
jgi:hypothetical protein